jgi:ATP-dependent helicase STH1/SNF2
VRGLQSDAQIQRRALMHLLEPAKFRRPRLDQDYNIPNAVASVNKRSKQEDVHAVNMEREIKKREEEHAEAKKRAARRLFLQDVLVHASAFKDYHAKLNVHVKKMSVQVLQYITASERRKRKEEDKERKLRMKALKANDMDAYMKLVQNHKNDRLSQLIEQTNVFLKQIGEKVESENVIFCLIFIMSKV